MKHLARSNPGLFTCVAAILAAVAVVLNTGCDREPARTVTIDPSPRPSILLVTLDTTRADSIGPGAHGGDTPAFTALAARGRLFRQAYATAPETLPSHSSMMTGLYPGGHGVHENGRHLAASHPVIAERLKGAGYRTGAFVSSFILSRGFGLARGFDTYDDEQPAGRSERTAVETTDRALAWLAQSRTDPVFLWVHYFDPHAPYEPPEPFRSRYRGNPYLGEIAAMDQQLGRLVTTFDVRGDALIVVAGDHGEGLGEHGESQHGHLVYQSTMRVPLVIAGRQFPPGVSDEPVSVRRIFHTLSAQVALETGDSLLPPSNEVVLGEAMKPFLEYGWLPQTMAVHGTRKAIQTRALEVYDLSSDPSETKNLGSGAEIPAAMRKALDDYPVPSTEPAPAGAQLNDDARRRLASLGYVSATARPMVRPDAPRPADRIRLIERIERASGLFVEERYREAIPQFEQILREDPFNLDAALRLATAHSILGNHTAAMAAFRSANRIAPRSSDVKTYLALHYTRGQDWARAEPLLEQIVAETPDRLPAVEGLALVRERQGRVAEAIGLRQKLHAARTPSAAELLHLARLAMSVQQTAVAIDAFEAARKRQGPAFANDLELGALYLAARRFEEARTALDRVPPSHPEYPMALFKRAQVSVLLNEPDHADRIAAARRRADATTRPLIEREALFRAGR
jgi:arylsulfatase A-like enzyme/Tfp pilus assembly protein PilF